MIIDKSHPERENVIKLFYRNCPLPLFDTSGSERALTPLRFETSAASHPFREPVFLIRPPLSEIKINRKSAAALFQSYGLIESVRSFVIFVRYQDELPNGGIFF